MFHWKNQFKGYHSKKKRDFARLDKFSDKVEYKYRRKSVDLQW